MRFTRLLPLLCGLLALWSCTENVQVISSVESYSDLNSVSGRRVAVVSLDDALYNTLQFKAFAEQVGRRLASHGMVVVEPHDDPDYFAFFDYSIDDGEQVSSTYSVPEFGVTGYSGGYTTGSVSSYGGYGTYSSQTTLVPQYGITGYSNRTETWREYTRGISLVIVDIARSTETVPEIVFESGVVSSGSCQRLASMMPYLLNAMFADFPRTTSREHLVEIPPEQFNC